MHPAADTARLFIALWPPADVRAALSAWRDGGTWPRKALPVRTEQLHVTLHFLGDVARARLPALAQGLSVPFAPFAVDFGHPELWHGGIAVLVPALVPAPLLALHGALGAALAQLGLPLEARPYRPHVTLARRAGPALAPLRGPPIRWQVDGYALMASTLGAGADYGVVQSFSAL